MIKALAAAAAGVLLAGPALAQTMEPAPAPFMGISPSGGMVPTPTPGMGGPRGGMRMLGLAEPREASPPPRGAEFTFRRGPMEVVVRCGDNEPVKPCADAALVLMDKFSTMTPAGPMEAPPPAPPGSAPSGDAAAPNPPAQ